MTYFCKICAKPIASSGRRDHMVEAHPSGGPYPFPLDCEELFTRDQPPARPEPVRRDAAPVVAEPKPIELILHCPECRARHVDTGIWATKLHHTHSCQTCGFTWRPAVVHTVGVQFLPGFKNESPEWETLCKSCCAYLHDAEFREAKQTLCKVCGFSGGMLMNDYLSVRAPAADTVRKGRIERGEYVLP